MNSLILQIKSETAQKIFSNTVYQLVGKVFSMSVTIFVTIIVTRNYGRVGFGEFNLMQSFPALFFILADFGLNAIATRELSKDFKNAGDYLGNIILIRLVMSLLLFAFAFFVLRLFPYNQDLLFGIYLGMFLLITQALYSSTNIIFQVKLRYDLSTIGLVAGSLTILVLAFLFSYYKLPISIVNFSYVIGGIVTFLINLYFLRHFDLNISFKPDKTLWNYLLLQSWPIGLTFVFSQINFKADSIMISVFDLPKSIGLSNTESVAVYGLPYKIFEVLLVVPTFFMNSMYPIYVRHFQESKKKLLWTFRSSIFVLSLLAFTASVFTIVLSPLVINILGGEQFSQSVIVLRLLALGLVIFYISQPVSWLLVTLGRQQYLPLIYLIAAIFNLILNYIMIPRYSFYASSIITWLSEGLILVLLTFFALKVWNEQRTD